MITKNQIGLDLLVLLKEEFNIVKISRWAESIYSNHCRELTPETEDIIMSISSMEHGPEFEYTKQELELLAEMLINDENDPIKKINEMKRKGILGF